MLWILLISFGVSGLLTLFVIATAHRHDRWSADHDVSGPQKMHVNVVPRVGGVGIAAGLVGGAIVMAVLRRSEWQLPAALVLVSLPTLVFGLIEDFTKSVSPRRRLVATALSGVLGWWLLDALIVRTGWPWFDATFAGIFGVGLALTIFTVAGVTNSINIIDGMNGLASMCMAMIMTALAYSAHEDGDAFVFGMSLAAIGASLGFFIWNYPRGLIFLGDGGAYLLGVVFVELGLMLIHRNPRVSPLAPLVLVAYPVFETVFTMYRRKIIRGRAVSMPDGIHLHTLIYRRLMRWAVGKDDPAALTRGNSLTSPYLWVLSSMSVVPATIFWDNTPVLAISLVVFVLIYLRVYWRIVRFRTPAWMSRVARRG